MNTQKFTSSSKSFRLFSWLILSFFLNCFLSFSAFSASYDVATKELSLPNLVIDDVTLTDARIKLNENGTFELISGTPSAIPLECNTFNELIVKTIETGKSVDEINNILGCKWTLFATQRNFSDPNATLSDTYQWSDNQCSTVSAHYIKSTGEFQFSFFFKNFRECKTFGPSVIYKLYETRFLIPLVIFDNTHISAADTVLVFNRNGTYQIQSFEMVESDTTIPKICKEISLEKFNLISTGMLVSEVEAILNCNKSFIISNTYGWQDDECSQISLTIDETGRVSQLGSLRVSYGRCVVN